MKYKIGDFVRLIDEKGEGYITSIINDELIGVTDEDGFEIPVLASKVTTIHGDQDNRKKKTVAGEVTVAEASAQTPFVEKGLFLVLTGDPHQGLVSFFLVNASSYDILFSFSSIQSGKLKGEKMGTLELHSEERIYTANAATISNWPAFKFQIIFYTEGVKAEKAVRVLEKRIRPADLSMKKKAVPLLSEKGWVFDLEATEEEPDTEKLKEHFISHRPAKR